MFLDRCEPVNLYKYNSTDGHPPAGLVVTPGRYGQTITEAPGRHTYDKHNAAKSGSDLGGLRVTGWSLAS